MLLKLYYLWRKFVLNSFGGADSVDAEIAWDVYKARADRVKKESWKQTSFNSKKQVRVLLYRECDWRGRKLLFDSKTVRKVGKKQPPGSVTETLKPPASECCLEVVEDGILYQYLKPCSDTKMLGEMIFGSVAMSFKGTMMKIHMMRSPSQIMISLVFQVSSGEGPQVQGTQGSLQSSTSEVQINKCAEKSASPIVAHSVPVDVPGRMSFRYHREESHCYSTGIRCSLEELENSFKSTGSTNSLLSLQSTSPAFGSPSSLSSLHRRWHRNRTTSIEFGLQRQSDKDSSIEEVRHPNHRSAAQKKIKLGLSVIFSINELEDSESSFQDFFFSHISLIEAHVQTLRNRVTQAYTTHRRLHLETLYKGLEKFQMAVQDLYTAPRLTSPVWLTLSLGEQQRTCAQFMHEFAALLDEFDSKQSNFFVSTLMTAVLTHHLAWVPTVTPPSVASRDAARKKLAAQWVNLLSKSHPYNPLWMQLGDLFGALGSPVKVARTVVVGNKSDLVLRFLYVLSYFIRCSDVYVKNISGLPDCAIHSDSVTQRPVIKVTSEGSSSDSGFCSSHSEEGHHLQMAKQRNLSYQKFPVTPARAHCYSTESEEKKHVFILGGSPLCSHRSSSNERTLTSSHSSGKEEPCRLDSLGYGSMEDSFVKSTELKSSCQKLSLPRSVSHSSFHAVVSVDEGRKNSCAEGLLEESLCGEGECFEKRHVVDSAHNSSVSGISSSPSDGSDSGSPAQRTVCSQDVNRTECCMLSSNKSVEFNICCDNSGVKNPPTKVPNVSRCNKNCVLNLDRTAVHKNGLIESPCSCNSEKKNMNIEQTRLYIQEYHSLRFAPERCSEFIDGTSKQVHGEEKQEEGYCSLEEARTPEETSKSLGELLSCDTRGLLGTVAVKLPRTEILENNALHRCGLGWSLMAGISSHFMPDFCLQGVQGTVDEVQIQAELAESTQVPILGEPVSESVCIIADTNHWSIHLVSSNRTISDRNGSCSVRVSMSPLVGALCESILQFCKLKMPPEFCLMHLDDKLQEFFFHSQSLVNMLTSSSEQIPLSLDQAVAALGLDPSDVPLLVGVATTYSPQTPLMCC